MMKSTSKRYQRLTREMSVDGIVEIVNYGDYGCSGCYGCSSGEDYCRGGRYYGEFEISQPHYAERYRLAEILIRLHTSEIAQHRGYSSGVFSVPRGKVDARLVYALSRRIENDANVLAALANEDSYEVVTCGGYYGEEIDGIVIDDQGLIDALNDHASEVLKIGRRRGDDAVREALLAEYGRLLPELKAATFELHVVDASMLATTNRTPDPDRVAHYRNGIQDFEPQNEKLPVRGRRKALTAPGAYPIAIVRERDNKGQYRVIDGNHRVTAYGNAKRSVLVLVAVP